MRNMKVVGIQYDFIMMYCLHDVHSLDISIMKDSC